LPEENGINAMSNPHPNVSSERPNREDADRKPKSGTDRPGFDLGGKNEVLPSGPTSGTTTPGGPKRGPVRDATPPAAHPAIRT
jgi:hypothetical protein